MSEKMPAELATARGVAHHFGMLYFHFCKTLVEALGEDKAFDLAQKAVFDLAVERSDGSRKRADAKGLSYTLENFAVVNDLPVAAWRDWKPAYGGYRCPYAEVWQGYIRDYPWFKRFATRYCDVIDTTNIENFSRTTSHKLTKSLLWGDDCCDREYFESESVKKGEYTYGQL